ncbi:MAG: o-succinylbenzoate synthase [Cytophagales bacterium CG12_big_fil_rev_8_21_14_0_65_40_12]|nr:MAG: o-succinylbenzoate synthase [Cytophagales bacterium CG12_big_fil_rev_8_21_14_0_65_40_12]PIW04030.1 MAG: o-succinylbenzoate synthase [Cytophagales bacterium CG17_big_fil_post_rev_8_21_14_2_50_40_13]
MQVHFEVIPHILKFRFEAGTSRGAFTEKETWFIKANTQAKPEIIGWGEASPLKGLSLDYSTDYEVQLKSQLVGLSKLDFPEEAEALLTFIAEHIPANFPSIRFGVETALLDLINGGRRMIFNTDFVRGKQRMPINGLIWMGDVDFMQQQIEEKLKEGFSTIKIKIGAIDFERELDLLEGIRKRYSSREITLRVDANGAFTEADVFDKLEQLASLEIHSIEQPIMAGQQSLMKSICEESPMDIALDEELIGVNDLEAKKALLEQIKPQYIILKPSLLGGILACREWIALAESMNIGWWMTSMLESNIGLNAIAQFTSQYQPILPQGLGTGKLYHNNIESPLEIRKGELLYNFAKDWGEIS